MPELASKEPVWHKSCYASFRSKQNLLIITKRNSVDEQPDQPDNANVPTTRTEVPKVDWTKCIFCQSCKRENVHQVQSKEVHRAINKIAEQDHYLKCRIGDNDLIAYEAHYHKSCKYQAENKQATDISSQTESESISNDTAWLRLADILDFGFQQGHIFQMDAIVTKYTQILSDCGADDQNVRSDMLKVKLKNHFGESISFRNQRNPNQPSLVFQHGQQSTVYRR
jgi:hypothetical protein